MPPCLCTLQGHMATPHVVATRCQNTPWPQRPKKAQLFHCFYLLLVTTRG